jgi:hypothetical protein
MFPLLTFAPFCKPHLKARFTQQEDSKLSEVVQELGTRDWQQVARQIPGRNARQCRERWLNYLSPDVRNGPWTPAEEQLLLEKYAEFGPAWKRIATFFPTRTDINVKSRWQLMQRHRRKEVTRILLEKGFFRHNVLLSTRLSVLLGISPVTQTPLPTLPLGPPGEEDIWRPLLMNYDGGMGGILDQWY